MKKFLAIALSLVSGSVMAGQSDAGTLSNIHFMGGGTVIAYTDGARTDVPSCAHQFSTRYAFTPTTEAGKAKLAGLLTAYAAGKKVIIYGTGDCSVWGDTETISYFVIAD